MDQFIKNLFGGGRTTQSPAAPAPDSDFADFASAPEPAPVPILSGASSQTLAAPASPTPGAIGQQPLIPRPYTKWYRVWERVQPSDFYSEMFIVPFLVLLVLVHFWGSRKNKAKAKAWMVSHGPVLQQEYASVGFSGQRTNMDAEVLANHEIPDHVLKPRAAHEFVTYATGRQNVAFLDVKLSLAKRYNPMVRLAEEAVGMVVESMAAPKERMEATAYVFDGREAELVLSRAAPDQKREKSNSTYDGFVWAVVHKDFMQFWRSGRYDLSLTTTRDHPKLPSWAVIMSESAEVTDALLKEDLVKAIHDAEDSLEALVVSDQPVDKPIKLDETIPKKRVTLVTRLPSGTNAADYSRTVPLFTQFLRLPDVLVSGAHFRPEVLRKIRATRDEEIKKLKKLDEDEKAEERRTKSEKEKRKEREEKLRSLTPEEQKKFLEKERQTDLRRGQKKRTTKA